MYNESNSAAARKRPREEISFESLVSPNFEELARIFPDFQIAYRQVQEKQKQSRPHQASLESCITQEFSIALTKALLHEYFSLSLTYLPSNHLCPPIPNRFYYVRWMRNDLLPLLNRPQLFESSTLSYSGIGLDIGTGSSCIYPLLFAASNRRDEQFHMYASDIDTESIQLARLNVECNGLQDDITVLLVPPSAQQQQHISTINSSISDSNLVEMGWGPLYQSLLALPIDSSLPVDFCMTNPPFYDDQVCSERVDSRKGDGRQRTSMTVSEGSYPGGEVGFVVDIIVDGLFLHSQMNQHEKKCIAAPPRWSSCMCGKKASWIKLRHIIEQVLGPSNVQTTEFGPGHLTRWFLAWTFERPQIRSPCSWIERWSFPVNLGEVDTNSDAKTEVATRISDFARYFTGAGLTASTLSSRNAREHLVVVIVESFVSKTWEGDEFLPIPIQNLLQQIDFDVRRQFLPREGHFLLEVTITPMHQARVVQVLTQGYSHSIYGRRIVDKFKSLLQAEVCRTNRRWRRRLRQGTENGVTEHMDLDM